MSKNEIQPTCGESAASHMTERPKLPCKAKFSGANGDSEKIIFPVQPTTSRKWRPSRSMPHNLLNAVTMHYYMHTHNSNNVACGASSRPKSKNYQRTYSYYSFETSEISTNPCGIFFWCPWSTPISVMTQGTHQRFAQFCEEIWMCTLFPPKS